MTVEFDWPKDRLFIGNAITITDDIVDENGDSQDMTGWALAFIVRAVKPGGYDPLSINATTGNGKITLSIPPGGIKLSRATIVLVGADTTALKPFEKYRYAVWRTDAGFESTLTEGSLPVSYPPPFPAP